MDLQPALDLIKQFEKCKLEAYQDIRGIWTIGWGCTGPNICEGMTITQDQADQMLAERFNEFASEVQKCLTRPATDNQVCAFISLAYNIGIGEFKSSTLLKMFNNDFGDDAIAGEFLLWDHAAGKEVEGLLRRREAERALFLAENSPA